MLRKSLIGLMIGLGACASHHPTASPAPAPLEPNPTPINASASRTWDALVQTLVDQRIPTATVSKESGLVDSGPMNVGAWGLREKMGIATDCGFGKTVAIAHLAFLVRGDSTHSTLRITPSYTGTDAAGGNPSSCNSTGHWESTIAHAVKTHAEGR